MRSGLRRGRAPGRGRGPPHHPCAITAETTVSLGSSVVVMLVPDSPGTHLRSPRVFSIVLAGGEGKRLWPLTADRAKPAVPFGGNYRLIDFVLSNLVNAGFRRIVVLTQYKSHSLDRHISDDLAAVAAPRQLRDAGAGPDAARAAVVRRLGRRDLPEPEPDLRRAARLRPRLRRRSHLPDGPAPDARRSTSTPAPASRSPASASRVEQADQFGVIETAADGRTIDAFLEKPATVAGARRRPRTRCSPRWATTSSTAEALHRRSSTPTPSDDSSSHDIGGDIIPRARRRRATPQVYDFADNSSPGRPSASAATGATSGRSTPTTTPTWTWSRSDPVFNLYNSRVADPTRCTSPLPAGQVRLRRRAGRTGTALDSMVCAGVIVSGGIVRRSVLSPGVRVALRGRWSRTRS